MKDYRTHLEVLEGAEAALISAPSEVKASIDGRLIHDLGPFLRLLDAPRDRL